MHPNDIDQRIYDLYDEYCHSEMPRREFLKRASAMTIAGISGLVMAQALLPRYAEAQTIQFTDKRMKATYVEYDSPGGSSDHMRGYLAEPASDGPHPTVIVIHENRGLNPYVEDVARRLAVEGYLALAPDGLFPVGGYPGNDDDGKILQRSLDQSKLKIDMLNSAQFVLGHASSNGKLGAVGFCWGGGATNYLAVQMGGNLHAGVPFYGAAPKVEEVVNIKAPLLIQSAEEDKRINALWPDFESALKANDVNYERHVYPGAKHGFHNNSTPRYNEDAATLAWQRTLAFFKTNLA
ncbi:MAG: carboxymethylenebutenolidase [Parasphingorhabdus sp.]|jgi:carboxymethylenebutenolidase